MRDPNVRIVLGLARRATDRICRRIIRQLQAITDDPTREHLPHIRTCWDAVCIQVQGEESALWFAYLIEIELRLNHEVAALPELERLAIWLQTSSGSYWECRDQRDDEPPIQDSDIVSYVQQALLNKAADWTNSALRAQRFADDFR